MGLDAVEIMMAVEDAFDIRLRDEDMVKVRTPRDLVEVVMRTVAPADSSACLTQRAFNLLRQALLRHLPLKRRAIAPSVRLAEIVPKPNRAALLENLASELKTEPLPDLVRPQWLVNLLIAQSLAAGLAVGLVSPRLLANPTGTVCFWVGAFIAVLVLVCGWIATARSCVEFPPGTTTVGDLSRWILAHKSDLANRTPGRWTREQVAARVREIVIEHLGCGNRYREDALFIEDLGVN